MTTRNDYRNPARMTDLERQMASPMGRMSTFENDQYRARIEDLKDLLREVEKAMPADLRTHRGLRERISVALQ